MRLLLCGGGTAGHINPAIAIAEELRDRDKQSKILFIGREDGLENEAIIKAGFDLKTIRASGLKRSISVKNIKSIFLSLRALITASKIIEDFSPDIILGTGGYICWPVITAGRLKGVSTVIHESNAYPGLTTRLLAKQCDLVLLGVASTKELLPKNVKTVFVGNPLRKDFKTTSYERARATLGIKKDDTFILSFGGSLGAKKINDVVVDVMKNYSSNQRDIVHYHATGRRYFEDYTESDLNIKNTKCKILPYIENMPIMLCGADIVICRSGAMTIAELSQVGTVAILIPSPNVTENHQYKNAKALFAKNAAVLIEEKELSSEGLTSEIMDIKNDKIGRKIKAKNIKAFSTPNSAKNIVDKLFMVNTG